MTSKQDQKTAEVADVDIALRIMEREDLGIRQLLEKYGGKIKALLRWKFGAQFND